MLKDQWMATTTKSVSGQPEAYIPTAWNPFAEAASASLDNSKAADDTLMQGPSAYMKSAHRGLPKARDAPQADEASITPYGINPACVFASNDGHVSMAPSLPAECRVDYNEAVFTNGDCDAHRPDGDHLTRSSKTTFS